MLLGPRPGRLHHTCRSESVAARLGEVERQAVKFEVDRVWGLPDHKGLGVPVGKKRHG